jgi:hypothetical protein
MGRVRKRSMTPLLRSLLNPTAVPIAEVVRFSASSGQAKTRLAPWLPSAAGSRVG